MTYVLHQSDSMRKIASIAIVGPDSNPLFIRKYVEEQSEIEIETLLFCSLDSFDPSTNKSKASFMGNIHSSDRFKVWGYLAPLNYKIMVLTLHIANVQEAAVKGLMESIKTEFFKVIADPFYVPFSVIKTQSFVSKMDRIVEDFDK